MMIRLHQAEALEWIGAAQGYYDLIFMDPPDNIGLDYGPEIDDSKEPTVYYDWLRSLILKSMRRTKVIWISYYHYHDLEVKSIVRNLTRGMNLEARTFIWNFNFGQYRETDCSNCYRPILRISLKGMKWNCDGIRVESARMRSNDKRAQGPKVPGDVWEFPRITGNHNERRPWIKTQHPEALLEWIVLMSGAKNVLELFSGSGTMIRVCKRLGVDLDTVELNSDYVKELTKEHSLCK